MSYPKLVASDVDGTLLDEHDLVSERTRDVVAALVDDAVPFVLSTGRPPRWIGMVVDQLGYAPVCVCANGAVIYDSAGDKVLAARTLDPPDLAWLAEQIMDVLPGAGLAAERVADGQDGNGSDTSYFVSAPGYEHAWMNPDNIEVDESEVLAAPAVKLLIRLPGAQSADMRNLLAPRLGTRADITFSTSHGLIEVAAPGITKATGLATVASSFGVAAGDVVAFGDMPNDVPMLRWAGHGVAMGNAHGDVRAVADEVTTPNSDHGVARVLERWWGRVHV